MSEGGNGGSKEKKRKEPSVSRFMRGRGCCCDAGATVVSEENTTLRLAFRAREGCCVDAGAMVGRIVSVPHFERDGLLLASQWVMPSSFQERRRVGGKCTPLSRVSSEGGDGGQAPCTVATVGCLVTRPPTLDSMDVQCDEEGFNPPGHIENGV